MNSQHDTDYQLSQALDIVEAGRSISEEQLQQLLADEDLQSSVGELLSLKSELRAAKQPVDVEARLRLFKASHASSAVPTAASTSRLVALRRRLWVAVAVAAVLVGAVFLVQRVARQSAVPAVGVQESPLLFTADAEPAGLQLTNEQGQSVVLSPATRQSTAVTLDDFRKVLNEVATERVTLNVPYGKSADITLPDGSVACLHPGSRLVFPTAFDANERVVLLDGEAYFRVARDEQHPFIVMAGDVETTVLGTEFNVDSHSNTVTLVSGSVRVSSGDQSVVLSPRTQCKFADGHLTQEEVDTTPFEMWRDGYLYFDNVTLHDIMLAIGQNFNMSVELRNEEAMQLRMRFIAERNNGVEAAIQTMNRMRKVSVQQADGRLIVW